MAGFRERTHLRETGNDRQQHQRGRSSSRRELCDSALGSRRQAPSHSRGPDRQRRARGRHQLERFRHGEVDDRTAWRRRASRRRSAAIQQACRERVVVAANDSAVPRSSGRTRGPAHEFRGLRFGLGAAGISRAQASWARWRASRLCFASRAASGFEAWRGGADQPGIGSRHSAGHRESNSGFVPGSPAGGLDGRPFHDLTRQQQRTKASDAEKKQSQARNADSKPSLALEKYAGKYRGCLVRRHLDRDEANRATW